MTTLSQELIERVRGRLAADAAGPGLPTPARVARAVQGEGQVLGDAEVLASGAAADRGDLWRRTARTAAGGPAGHRRPRARARPGAGSTAGAGLERAGIAFRGRVAGAQAGPADGFDRRSPPRRRRALRRRPAAERGAAARRASAGRHGRHLHLAAAAAQAGLHPGRARRRSARSTTTGRTCSPDWSPRGRRCSSPAAPGPARPPCSRPCSAWSRPSERIVLVEDCSELRPDHPHVVRLEGATGQRRGSGSGRAARPRPAGAADAA